MVRPDEAAQAPTTIGRYVIGDPIGLGGMASIHIARELGDAGDARTVAIKRLHPQFANDPGVLAMLVDEARLAARVRHPNVVPVLDIVLMGGELLLVLEYIHGESLAGLQRAVAGNDEYLPIGVAAAIVRGVLHGLHAAHEATTVDGDALGIVHRDVSPQNVLVGADGVARVLDFGVAQASGRLQTTEDGQLKGKLAYMAPEQLTGKLVDRRTDVFACGVLLWELLAGKRLFLGQSPGETLARVLDCMVERPSLHAKARRDPIPPALDLVALRALARSPEDRYPTAMEMAVAIEGAVATIATAPEVGACVRDTAGASLERLATLHRRAADLAVSASPALPAEPQRAPRRGRGWQYLLGALLVGALPTAGWLAAHAAAPAGPGGAALSASTAPSSPVTEAASILVSASAPPSTPVLASSGSSPVRASPPPPRRRTRPAPSRTSSPPPSCVPPYTVDAEGVHVPKPECG